MTVMKSAEVTAWCLWCLRKSPFAELHVTIVISLPGVPVSLGLDGLAVHVSHTDDEVHHESYTYIYAACVRARVG